MTKDQRRTPPRLASLVFGLLCALLAACAAPATTPPAPPPAARVAAAVTAASLASPAQPCSGTFVPHTLDYTTTAPTRPAVLYDSNGAGLALGDLDADGDQDVALANLAGPSAVLWNNGALRFTRQDLPVHLARGVTAVDVDADGLLDLVFTRRGQKPALLRNTGLPGPARFAEATLPDVNTPLYTLTWDDLDRDGDLDMVGASYDTELLKIEGPIFERRGGGVGVFVYERRGDAFVQHRLATQADALAIALPDLDGDGRRDILVGNDFTRPDYVWLQGDGIGAWRAAMPFRSTTENTMSLDIGDIDNDGDQEIFATDMKPLEKDVATLARWLPMMQKMSLPTSAADPQQPENALQVRDRHGTWENEAYERMIDSSGWSWSGKFGDLDRDGFLDVYVVNGMIAAGLFDHLPGRELVEPNVVFRNDGRGVFATQPAWGLDATASGRGMSMADLDGDGDLDIVVNNLGSPAQLFENRTCGGASVLADLRWPASSNVYAVGAALTLHTSAGAFRRDVRAASGYLSGDTAQVHFGIPHGATIERLTITWPDGAVSEVAAVAAQTRITVTR